MVVRQRLNKHLRKAAPQVDSGNVLRQVAVLERAERHDLCPVLLQQLEILRVVEIEGIVIGDSQADLRRAGGLALEYLLRDEREQLRLLPCSAERVLVAV